MCQLRCPSCPTATREIKRTIGGGVLSFADFQTLLDVNPFLEEIELSNWGEIFLNPELLSILRYAHEKRVALSASNGANLNFVRPDVLEGVVKYGLRRLTCSIDGASEESYRAYRVNGSFTRVIENIRTINRYKQQYGSTVPRLRWQFIIFGHNEHDIPRAKEMARALDMEILFKPSWENELSPPQGLDRIRDETGLDLGRRRDFWRHQHHTFCAQLWKAPQIHFDGRILGCCVNHWGDFGSAPDWRLADALNNEKIKYAREMLRGVRPARDDIPCTTCHHYARMKANEDWMEPPHTRAARSPASRRIRGLYRRLSGWVSGQRVGNAP